MFIVEKRIPKIVFQKDLCPEFVSEKHFFYNKDAASEKHIWKSLL